MNNAVLAGRVFGACVIGQCLVSFARYLLERALVSPDGFPSANHLDLLKGVGSVGSILATTATVLLLAALAMLCTSVVGSLRRWALLALALGAGGNLLGQGLHLVILPWIDLANTDQKTLSALLFSYNTLTSLTQLAGMILALYVLFGLARGMAPVFLAGAGVSALVVLFGLTMMWWLEDKEVVEWFRSLTSHILWLVRDLSVGLAALWMAAKMKPNGEQGQDRWVKARPLAWLAWALVARLVLMLVSAVLIPLLGRADDGLAWNLLCHVTWLSLATALFVAAALGTYLSYPRTLRGSATLWFTVVAVGITQAIDLNLVYAARGFANYVQRFTDSENLWQLIPSYVLGYAATLCLAVALGKTASAADALEQRARVSRIIKLQLSMLVVGSLLGICLVNQIVVGMVVVGLVTFGVSVALLVNWFQLLFGTARAVERMQVAGDEPAPLVPSTADSVS